MKSQDTTQQKNDSFNISERKPSQSHQQEQQASKTKQTGSAEEISSKLQHGQSSKKNAVPTS